MNDRRRSEILARYRARARQFDLVARRSGDLGPLPAPQAAPPRREVLTPRERQTLTLIACGLSNREIGGHLYLTEETIKNHVANVLAKLGASNRAHAVALGIARGLIDVQSISAQPETS